MRQSAQFWECSEADKQSVDGLKYIVVGLEGCRETLWAFPKKLVHFEVARRKGHVISAGFIRVTENGFECYGESESLEIRSRGNTDSAMLPLLLARRS